MSELRHLRRLQRGPLGVIHPHRLVRGIVRHRRPGRHRLAPREAMQHVDRHALRIAQSDDGSSPWSVGRLDRTAGRLGQPLEVAFFAGTERSSIPRNRAIEPRVAR